MVEPKVMSVLRETSRNAVDARLAMVRSPHYRTPKRPVLKHFDSTPAGASGASAAIHAGPFTADFFREKFLAFRHAPLLWPTSPRGSPGRARGTFAIADAEDRTVAHFC